MKSTATTTEGVGPIKEQHVQANIQVQRGAEALDQGNDTGTGAGQNSQACVVDQEGRDTALEHRQYLSQYVRLGCSENLLPVTTALGKAFAVLSGGVKVRYQEQTYLYLTQTLCFPFTLYLLF